MSTFQELKQKVESAEQRRTVLIHLITYLDATFRPVAGRPPEKVLVTDDKRAVPDAAFEAVIAELLIKEADRLAEEVSEVNGSTVSDKKEETSTRKRGKKDEPSVQTPPQGDQK